MLPSFKLQCHVQHFSKVTALSSIKRCLTQKWHDLYINFILIIVLEAGRFKSSRSQRQVTVIFELAFFSLPVTTAWFRPTCAWLGRKTYGAKYPNVDSIVLNVITMKRKSSNNARCNARETDVISLFNIP
jgi:hypothetical protein